MYIYLWAEDPTTVNKAREVFSAVSTNQNEKVPFYVKSDLFYGVLWIPEADDGCFHRKLTLVEKTKCLGQT